MGVATQYLIFQSLLSLASATKCELGVIGLLCNGEVCDLDINCFSGCCHVNYCASYNCTNGEVPWVWQWWYTLLIILFVLLIIAGIRIFCICAYDRRGRRRLYSYSDTTASLDYGVLGGRDSTAIVTGTSDPQRQEQIKQEQQVLMNSYQQQQP